MSVILPETAFISRFAIQVDDQVFVAFVKEKEDAWRLYQDAVTKGKTAGKAFESKKKFICRYDKTHSLVECIFIVNCKISTKNIYVVQRIRKMCEIYIIRLIIIGTWRG